MLLIGSRIQEYRKKAGLNQEEFAEKMGVSRQAVSKWERDKAYPDLDRLVCICEILDVQVGELIYGKGDEPEAPEEVSGDGTSANNAVHLKNLRGKGRLARLKILFCVMAAICVFCVIVVAVLFVRNEWTRHSDKNGNVRVEKVYQQYTKADLAYFDDNGRKIMDTVWLDVPGVRDGDYIQLYTGVDGDGLFLNYKTSTICDAPSLVIFKYYIFVCHCYILLVDKSSSSRSTLSSSPSLQFSPSANTALHTLKFTSPSALISPEITLWDIF